MSRVARILDPILLSILLPQDTNKVTGFTGVERRSVKAAASHVYAWSRTRFAS